MISIRMSYTGSMNYTRRQRLLEQELKSKRLESLLVTHPPNVRYLSGFTGSSAALLVFGGTRKPVLFTDGRYREQARQEVQRARVVVGKRAALAEAAAYAKRRKLSTLGLEADHCTMVEHALLRNLAKGVRFRAVNGMVERARMIKDEDELKLLEAAVQMGASLLKVAIQAIRPGVREVEVAAELEYAARKAGASGMSFDTIVASGVRSALPHGQASEARIPAKGFVVLDFGVILDGYCSDMTRTVHVSSCSKAGRQMYEAVRHAQEAAVHYVRDGVPCGEVDAAARGVLKVEGLDRYFTHSTGHGVGLEIHEPPRLGKGQPEPLRSGMVVTVEPGVYIPGTGGVRIEDMVVVTNSGSRILTPVSRELIEI
ncbi:MAG: M24 family metallopeptidase [Candidatus Korobacteraceae bacterium]